MNESKWNDSALQSTSLKLYRCQIDCREVGLFVRCVTLISVQDGVTATAKDRQLFWCILSNWLAVEALTVLVMYDYRKCSLLWLCVAKGELFGWGNTEYNQLGGGQQSDEMQVNVPRHIPLKNVVGRIVKVAAAGSSCALINGNLTVLLNFTAFVACLFC